MLGLDYLLMKPAFLKPTELVSILHLQAILHSH